MGSTVLKSVVMIIAAIVLLITMPSLSQGQTSAAGDTSGDATQATGASGDTSGDATQATTGGDQTSSGDQEPVLTISTQLKPIQLQPLQTSFLFKLTELKDIVVEPLADSFNRLMPNRILFTAAKTVIGWYPQVKFKWEFEQLSKMRILVEDINVDSNVEKYVALAPSLMGESGNVSDMAEADQTVVKANFDAGLALARKYFTSLQKALQDPKNVFKDQKGNWNVRLIDEAGNQSVVRLRYDAHNKHYSLISFPSPKQDLTKLDAAKAAIEGQDKALFSLSWTLDAPIMNEFGDLKDKVHNLLTTGNLIKPLLRMEIEKQ